MGIRCFQAGDDVAQVSIYNEAAAHLPKFKPATVDEIRRRCRGPEFDPETRFYAIHDGRPVGYVTCQSNGRISFPWCRKGFESHSEPLLQHVLEAMRGRGIRQVFSAYRPDWPAQREFFLRNGFLQSREMINYMLDLVDMPTPPSRPSTQISPLTQADLPAVLRLGKGVLRASDVAGLEQELFENPYFAPSSLFALRGRTDDQPIAVGILVVNPSFAQPRQVDANMPCFRLGAFGTEGLTTKRINGVFSFLAGDSRDLTMFGLDLLGYATAKIEDDNVDTLAAQVPSDATHLGRFYKSLFRRQGSFPLFERAL